LDSKGRENFGGLCACFETRLSLASKTLPFLEQGHGMTPAPDFGTVGFPDFCLLWTRLSFFCAAIHVSLTSAIELAEASLETV
jgi:hypothetical protein